MAKSAVTRYAAIMKTIATTSADAVRGAHLAVPPLPDWLRPLPDAPLETQAFQAGAALAHLNQAAKMEGLPLPLWRDRLALLASERCATMVGRREGQKALRDALHLTKPGDDPGPAGTILRHWSRVVERPISVAALSRAVEGLPVDQIALCLDARGAPMERAAHVIEAVLSDAPRGQMRALILADTALAQALGASHVMPLLALSLTSRDLSLRGEALRGACHRAALTGVRLALQTAAELARGAARLRTVGPKLRAHQADRAVELFLRREALPATALDFMSDRAARRLCERLVDLDALRELTGRDTFRLYGV